MSDILRIKLHPVVDSDANLALKNEFTGLLQTVNAVISYIAKFTLFLN